ncbi:DNA polymerase IV [Oikeobacillus pervagus]|nr:DNA polymerase IV [Oikeobacillus pervagus]
MRELYPKNGRVILHVDMNSFYASVEMAYDSTLRGKPLAIAGNPKERKGIIVTCSYEARKFGVKTTMPLWEAKKLCPNLIVRRPNFDRYRAASQEMFAILRQFSDWVEPVSIDEGYVDITDCFELGSPVHIAKMIQKRIMEQLNLPCSIGIAPNKFLAKMASDMKKPMGITILRKRDVPRQLWPLPVVEMHGIGKKTAEKLNTIQVFTIQDLAKANELQLRNLLGINGIRLKERANGNDSRKVDPNAVNEFKSVGNSITLPMDLTNQKELLETLRKLAEKVSIRLKHKKMVSFNIAIMIRYKNRKTITRSRKLPTPIFTKEEIFAASKRLFLEHWNLNAVRLLGVTAQELLEKTASSEQLNLFNYEEKAKLEPLIDTVKHLQDKYGKNIITKGIDVTEEQKLFSTEKDTSFNKDFLYNRED